jgi:hypothetical protein
MKPKSNAALSVESDNGTSATPPRDSCVYCGEPGQLTRDHVSPQSIFPNPKPSNLITVPACQDCNGGFRLDREYFRTFVVAGSYQSSAARGWWNRKIIGSPNAGTIRQILAGI